MVANGIVLAIVLMVSSHHMEERMARVLVADDDLFYRKIVSQWVMAMGHEVVQAHNGAEALALYDNGGFDLLVLDVFMDKMTGLELLKRLTRNAEIKATTRIPVVIITSDDSESTERTAREARATFFLLKPFSMETLVNVVEEAVKAAAPQTWGGLTASIC
jgi:CheY-like chemotaxis protein